MHNIIYCQRFSAILESHFHFHNSLNFDRFFLCEFCPKHLLKHFIEWKTIFGKSRTSACIYIYMLLCFNRAQNSSSQTQKLMNHFYKKTKLQQENYTIKFVINHTFVHAICYQPRQQEIVFAYMIQSCSKPRFVMQSRSYILHSVFPSM